MSTSGPNDHWSVVTAVIAANRFMTLATADAHGAPWANPVWFATDDHRRFLWVSSPETRHSRNIETRPEIAIVIYDSRTTPADRQAVYLEAVALPTPAVVGQTGDTHAVERPVGELVGLVDAGVEDAEGRDQDE